MVNQAFWKDKKVFLTGHTGFKGSWLAIWLNELGAEVCGYALEPNTTPSLFDLAGVDKIVQSHIGDIRDLTSLKNVMVEFNPDIVIHMAAQPLVRESYENPVDTYAINIMGTVNVLESARACESVKAIVNVTTDKVYDNKEWVWGYREDDVLGGYDPYSNSKACSELVTSAYVNSFFNPNEYTIHGVAIATARAGNVIGGGDWAKDRLIPDILRSIENNEEVVIRNPHAIRPWQHVLEPLSGYLQLSEKLYLHGVKWNGAWNFGPDSTSNKDVKWIVEYILSKNNSSSKISIKSQDNLHESNYLKLDCVKANEKLGWQPVWTLHKCIDSILEWDKVYKEKADIFTLCINQIRDYWELKNS